MPTLRIDLQAILEYMLQDLLLCKPVYEVVPCDNNLFVAHITMHTINPEIHQFEEFLVSGEQG